MTGAEAVAALREAGVEIDDAAFAEFMAGVVAAPALKGDEWVNLLGPDLPGQVKRSLVLHRDWLSEQDGSGLGDSPAPSDRLASVRENMRAQNLDGLIVPRTDEYQGEYIPARANRLQWVTGFSGSAGAGVIGLDTAAIFVDGRYTLQVQTQVDTDAFIVRHLVTEPVASYLEETFSSGHRVGYDAWLHTQSGLAGLKRAAARAGFDLMPISGNPIDQSWPTQPAPPLSPIRPHELEYAGETSSDKRARLAESLGEKGRDAAIITASDSIAWLLNVRGGDVSHCPLPLSFAILRSDGALDWYLDKRKLTPGLQEHLGNRVALYDIEEFPDALESLGAEGLTVQADPATTAAMVFDRLVAGGAKVVEGSDPCLLPKACKNAVELAGTKAAHTRDGAAVSRFLAWLPEAVANGGVTEISAADKLQAFRFRDPLIRDLSFDTISGAGPDGAIVHYRVTEQTDRPLKQGELYLVDSGGQYLDGTTDITRTIALGAPTDEMKDRFTRVLKGHIAIATARFPAGVSGGQLDALARQYLWQVGLDFDHGTGHGVGSYLNVHEGPQRIAKGSLGVPLEAGMILSNEPGFYKTGAYGIRIENLVIVIELAGHAAGEKPLLGFETITFAPIDLNLVDTGMLTDDERAWLNAYHRQVREKVAPQLADSKDADAAAWLEHATRKI